MRGRLSRRNLLGLGAVSAGGLGAGLWLRRRLPLGDDVSERVDVGSIAASPGYPAEGARDGAITMLVFSDYACGVCRQVEPWWRSAVRDAGDVRVIHRDWPILGPDSMRAARLALAAQYQGLYVPVHDHLMRASTLGEAALREAFSATGGDWSRLEADLVARSEDINRLLARTARDALQLGYRGTPGFLIGPIRIEGGASERQFADAINRARQAESTRRAR